MSRLQHAAQAGAEYFRLQHHFDRELASLTLAKHFAAPGSSRWKALDHSLNRHAMELLRPYAEGIPYEPADFAKPIGRDCPIWVYWGQGWNSGLPPVVSLCRKKLEQNAAGHPVFFLSQRDVDGWEAFPRVFKSRLNSGSMSFTHFSDILRMYVLNKWGGLYLDAAMLLTKPIPEELLDAPFFSVRHGQGADWLINEGLWITGVLGAGQGHPMTGWMLRFLEKYWAQNTVQLCYLLVDCALRLCMEQNEPFRQDILSVPQTNPGVFDFADAIAAPYDKAFFDKTLSENFLLRLSQKLPPMQGEDCIYHHVLKL